MKQLSAILVAAALAVALAVVGQNALARPEHEPPGHNGLKKQQELAGELCVAMARSGAYTALNDDDFSDFCIQVATHIYTDAYDHE